MTKVLFLSKSLSISAKAKWDSHWEVGTGKHSLEQGEQDSFLLDVMPGGQLE